MAERETMNVSLSSEQKAFVKGLVASGQYSNDSEVVREGLRLLDEHHRQLRLEALLLERLEGGDLIELNDATLAALDQRLAQTIDARRREKRAKSA